MKKKIIELISEIQHEAWMKWSKELAQVEKNISQERVARWRKFWIDYDKLTEDTKDFDREWARKVYDVFVPILAKKNKQIQELKEQVADLSSEIREMNEK